MTELTSYMDAFGDTLVANGYSVIPVIPAMKVPGRYSGGQWYPMDAWQRHCSRDTKPFELDIWKRWPGCGIGLACGAVVGIDIDILDAEISFTLERLARAILGDTPAMRIGRAPKRALFYRAKVPFVGKHPHPLEVIGLNGQMVIYGTHEITKEPYIWPGESLTEIDISKLPEITEAQAMEWLEAAYRLVPDELKPKTLSSKSKETSQWAGPSDPKGTYAAVKSALAYIPNDNVDGHSWIRMLNCIKGALDEAGRDLWLDWSTSSAKSGKSGKRDTAERRWKTAKPTSLGAGTIYYMAEQRGWIPEADLVLNGSVAADPDAPHPAAALLARMGEFGQPVAPLPAVPVPTDLWQIGGVLGQLIDLSVRTAKRPQPFLALAAALSCVGTLAGQKYKTSSNLRTNLYTLSLAASGAGKDNARIVNKVALYKAGLQDYLGGEFIASGQALLSSLKKHPCRLFQLDEIGKFIAECTNKNASPHKKEIWKNFTVLYTSAGSMMVGTEYANQAERPRENIEEPCASIYGVTVPETFWAALDGGAMSDGSVARFMVFLTDCNYPERNKRPDPLVISEELIDGLKSIALGMDEAPKGNLSYLSTSPTPYTVPFDAAALELLDEQDDNEDGWLRQAEGGQNGSILARVCENTRKIALVRAISDNPTNPRITAEIVRWAMKLVEHCAHTMTREGDRFISTNETEASHKRVLDIIRKAGTVTATMLSRKTQFLNGRTRDDIIRSLVQANQVAEDMRDTGKVGRPQKSYSIVVDDDVSGLTRH